MGKEADNKKDAAPAGASAGRFLRYVLVLLLAGATALAWLSVTSFNADDAPAGRMFPPAPAHNMAGWVGANIAYSMLYWLGDGSYMLLLFLSAVLLLALVGAKVGDLPWRLTGLSLMVTARSDSTAASCWAWAMVSWRSRTPRPSAATPWAWPATNSPTTAGRMNGSGSG